MFKRKNKLNKSLMVQGRAISNNIYYLRRRYIKFEILSLEYLKDYCNNDGLSDWEYLHVFRQYKLNQRKADWYKKKLSDKGYCALP